MLKTFFGLTTLVLLLVLIGYATSSGPSDSNLSDLGLTASAVRDPNGAWRLQFELRYTGEIPLVLYEGSLPWKNPHDLLLVGCALNAANIRLVPAEAPMRDLPPSSLTLNPGDTLSGSVNLSASRCFMPSLFMTRRTRSAPRLPASPDSCESSPARVVDSPDC